MEYQNKLSRLRNAFLKLQGQDLKQILLRAAAKRAEEIAHNVYTAEEIFYAVKTKIYEATNELSWNEAFELASDAESLSILKKELIEDTIKDFEWEETLFVLLEGLDERDTKLIEPLLRNQRAQLIQSEEWRSSSSSATATAGFDKLMIPITRRIFSDFTARNLVGVQPMTCPVGLTYTLQYKVEDKETGEQEILDKFDLQGNAGKRMSLEVISTAVEASTKKLSAGLTIEATADLYSMHGLNIEAELVAAVAQEIKHEINNEIICDLKHLGGETIEVVKLDGSSKEDQDLQLGCAIRRQSIGIATRTRRGAGNFVVTSSTIATIISEFSKSEFEPKSHPEGYTSDLMEVGTLNGTIKVFSATDVAEDEILVGYKGVSGEVDTGYAYCPYIPVLSSGIVVHPETFEPIVSLMTRAGKNATKKAEDYYSNIKVEGLPKPKKE